MHIAFFINSLRAGGAERVVSRLANYWAQNGRQVTVITLEDTESDFYTLHPDITRVVLNKAAQSGSTILLPWRVATRLYHLRRALMKASPNVLISTTTFLNMISIMATFRLKLTLYVRETTLPSALIKNGWKGRAAKLLYKWLYPFADRVICPSNKIATELKDFAALKNLAVVYNPIDVAEIRQEKDVVYKKNELTQEGRVHFICVGRLIPAKGFDRLIDALADCRFPFSWHLTIYGEGEERQLLESLIRNVDLTDKIKLAGMVDNPWTYMAAADCLLLPSRWEGMPNVVLEALSVGTPVIAMEEAGGIVDIASLAPRGAVTIANNMQEFVTAMQRVTSVAHAGMRPSLLPDAFNIQSVMGRLERLIEQKD